MKKSEESRPPSENDPEFWSRPVEQWMWSAAHQIDNEVGLARFDLAIAVTARIIAKYYTETVAAGQRKPSENNLPN